MMQDKDKEKTQKGLWSNLKLLFPKLKQLSDQNYYTQY